MIKKNKIIHLPKLHNVMGASRQAYVKAMLKHPRPKHPTDFVETLIEERKKQLMKEKKHEK
tara:strand:- start:253 stop:435 length:183 start_codon:yes stop_codon:yes gene_type:complete